MSAGTQPVCSRNLLIFGAFWGYPSVRRWTRFPQGFCRVRPESNGLKEAKGQ